MAVPTVLVLGATGLTGRATIAELLADHRAGRLRLVAAARRPEAAAGLAEQGVEVRRVDLDTAERHGLDPVLTALRGVDQLLLLSGYDLRMLAQSKAVIDAARRAGVAHVVHLGAHAAPDTTVVHLGWHQMIEAYLERSGVGYTHLHPTSFMQNLFMPMTSDVGSATLTHFIGDAPTSWVDAEDIAAVAAHVLRSPAGHHGKRYGLGTEVAAVGDIATILAEVTGRPWRYEPREPEDFFRAVTAAGADPTYMACVRNVFERTREGSLPDAADTFDDARTLLGRAPTSLRDFVARHREQFTAAGPSAA